MQKIRAIRSVGSDRHDSRREGAGAAGVVMTPRLGEHAGGIELEGPIDKPPTPSPSASTSTASSCPGMRG